jgi:copper transport protein
VLAAALLVTVVSSGHASVAGVVAYVADYAHLLAAATWTGGLAFLFAALVWAKERRWDLASRSVPLFSRLAVVVVAVLIVAGAVNGYLEVRSWHGLWDTEYGVLLLTKIALILPLLGLAVLNNRVAVPRLRSGTASARERRRFLRTVAAELTVMIVIVAVTAVLVDAAPPRRDVAHHAAESTTLELGPFVAQLDVEPARAGENEIRLTFGHGVPPDEVDIAATLVRPNIGPLLYRTRRESHGVFVARAADLPIAGPWEIRVDAARGNELFSETAAVSIGRP